MEHQLDFTVTRGLVTTATRRFWLQFIGWGGFLRWAAVSVVLVILSIIGRQAWSYAAVALVVVFVPLVWVGGYFTFLRRAFSRYGRMQSKSVSYRFTEASFGAKTDLGSGEVPWRMLDKVQRYPDVWLLFFGRRDYVYLPTAELTEPVKDYILQQAKKQGIKIV